MCQSLLQMPATAKRTRTSPGPGVEQVGILDEQGTAEFMENGSFH
jgi:hypothetical protein